MSSTRNGAALFYSFKQLHRMKRLVLIVLLLVSATFLKAQVSVDPACFGDETEITIYYDATKGTSGLVGASKVYMHSGVITSSPTGTSWQYVIGNWGEDDGIGQMTKVAGESDLWEITLVPRTYYDVPASTPIYRLAMVFRNEDGSKEGKDENNSDIFVNLSDGGLNLQLTEQVPALVDPAESVLIEASTCFVADYTLYINDVVETTATSVTTFSYSYEVTQSPGETINARLEATDGVESDQEEFSFTVRRPSISEPRPTGIIDGINYDDTNAGKVTLSLWAPMKSSVFVVGDFTNWEVDQDYQMKKDGEHFWLEITGLTPGQEYGYQFWVDEQTWIADPYADKILDPDDRWIPSSTYPNLKPYPEAALRSPSYFNRVAVLQTNQQPYVWQNPDFQKPAPEKLVVYELLIRDFLGEDNMNYQALIDTLDYLEDLGINAIELMPIMEFNGNESWGYNPTFMFAVDKAYGTRNDLKEFIDECHGRGIAVILDMVMNQNDTPSPYAMMYFDIGAFKPSNDNPWFNRDAKHPFNVFFDINHESEYTKVWLDTINHYWINEYKFDGYRFDLSKGFTQKFSSDVGQWSARDNSRITLLKRMADKIWEHTPDAYVILEHFADNSEEKELSDYGMMLWGNMNYDYNEATMGYANGKSLSGAYYKDRGWNNNLLVAYMESHDEERLMFKNQEFGNSFGTYNIKNLQTALRRQKLAGAFFYTVPGPKMLWQWGEYGYDIPLYNYGDGDREDGKLDRRDPHWEYLDDERRRNLLEVNKELIGLRDKYDVFTEGDFTWSPGGNFKSIHITKGDTNVTIVGNFDVQRGVMNPEFQNTGTWYDFFSGREFEVTNTDDPIDLGAGVFHIYTDKKLHQPDYDIITSIDREEFTSSIRIYPNPVAERLSLDLDSYLGEQSTWRVFNSLGQVELEGQIEATETQIDVRSLKPGLYLVEVADGIHKEVRKFIRE